MTAPDPKPDNTLYPNTFQKPNIFVDELMRLLTPTANLLLDVACRRILGWEKHRRTLRDRISTSQFMEVTGLSRQTVLTGTEILVNAKILRIVGKWNYDGQQYELNLEGGYDIEYLKGINRRYGNPTPDQSALHAKRNQLDMPDMAVLGGLNFRPVKILDQSNQFNETGELVRPPLVNWLDTQNPKLINPKDSLLVIDDCWTQLWQAALHQLSLEMPKTTFDRWLRNTQLHAVEQGDSVTHFLIACPDQYRVDWLTNRMTATVARALTALARQPITPKFIVHS